MSYYIKFGVLQQIRKYNCFYLQSSDQSQIKLYQLSLQHLKFIAVLFNRYILKAALNQIVQALLMIQFVGNKKMYLEIICVKQITTRTQQIITHVTASHNSNNTLTFLFIQMFLDWIKNITLLMMITQPIIHNNNQIRMAHADNHQCSDYDSQLTCSSFDSTTCDFQNGKCVQVYDCASIQSVHYCRKSRLSKRLEYLYFRCAALSDGKALTMNQKSAGIFESYSCQILNCKYWNQIYGGGCQPFVNGYQCFNTSTIACDQCSNYQNINSCINTGQCTWNANQTCTDIQCAQLTSPTQCATKQLQCQWYNTTLSCGLQANLTNAYCYPEFKYGYILMTLFMILF
ncbi:hypothetical protein pb186bvf_013051 [Paramecium bursaria]